MDAEDGAFLLKALTEIDRGGGAHIIGILFKRQTQDADALIFRA